MKLIVWMIQDAESVGSGHSHVTSQPVSFPPHPIPGRMPSRSVGMPSRRDGPPRIWDTHGLSGNVFADPVASSTAPHPQELNQWNSSIEEPLHSSTVEKSERQKQDQDLRCKSGPSAKNSVIFSGGDPSKNYGADQQRLHISDLHFDKFPTLATFACWKIKVCTCSQFPTEAMQWITEVELVDSVDDFRSSLSARGIRMPDFEVLDAKIASALNRIIHNTPFQKKVSLEEEKAQKEDHLPSWKTDRLPDLRVLPCHRSQRLCREFCRRIYNCSSNDDIQEFFEMGRNSIINDKDANLTTSWKDCTN